MNMKRLGGVLSALLVVFVPGGQVAGAHAQSAERNLGRLSVTHWINADLQLAMEGVYAIGVQDAVFYPEIMPSNAKGLVETFIRIPDGNAHRYRLDCQVQGDGKPGTTDYRLTDRDGTVSRTTTQARGAATVSFQIAVDYDAETWQYWILNNASNQKWLFFGCDVFELLA